MIPILFNPPPESLEELAKHDPSVLQEVTEELQDLMRNRAPFLLFTDYDQLVAMHGKAGDRSLLQLALFQIAKHGTLESSARVRFIGNSNSWGPGGATESEVPIRLAVGTWGYPPFDRSSRPVSTRIEHFSKANRVFADVRYHEQVAQPGEGYDQIWDSLFEPLLCWAKNIEVTDRYLLNEKGRLLKGAERVNFLTSFLLPRLARCTEAITASGLTIEERKLNICVHVATGDTVAGNSSQVSRSLESESPLARIKYLGTKCGLEDGHVLELLKQSKFSSVSITNFYEIDGLIKERYCLADGVGIRPTYDLNNDVFAAEGFSDRITGTASFNWVSPEGVRIVNQAIERLERAGSGVGLGFEQGTYRVDSGEWTAGLPR